MASPKALTVLIADQHSVTRAGVKAVLANCKVIEAEDFRQTIQMAENHRPDVAVIDIALPRLNGIIAANHMIKSGTSKNVLILSEHCDEQYVDRALAVGVRGFLCKQSDIEMLVQAVSVIASGKEWFDPPTAEIRKFSKHLPAGAKVQETLTPRELEVAIGAAWGLTDGEIGKELGISEGTVGVHLGSAMKTLRLKNRVQLTHYCIKAGHMHLKRLLPS